MTEEYELSTYDRHELNYDNVALGRLPVSVMNADPMITPLRELVYLPKGVLDPHDLPPNSRRPGKLPEEILEEMESAEAQK
jgi:NAD(P)H-quinone oxidoreductase subunit I